MDAAWFLTLILAFMGTTTSFLVLLSGIMIGKGRGRRGYLFYALALILTFMSYFLYTELWRTISLNG